VGCVTASQGDKPQGGYIDLPSPSRTHDNSTNTIVNTTNSTAISTKYH